MRRIVLRYVHTLRSKSLEPKSGVTQQDVQPHVESAAVSEPNVVSDSVDGQQPSEVQETKEESTPASKAKCDLRQ